jgi:predicted alpha-1,2-mannosidase
MQNSRLKTCVQLIKRCTAAQLIYGIILIFSVIASRAETSCADYVDPLIESSKSRYFYFNSACRPFGMVNLSPDTILEGEWSSGYRYDEPYIRGFTHVHDFGVGGLLIMPTVGNIDPTQGPENWKSHFSHRKEIAKAGYHQVYLDRYHIRAELTSSTRVGFHQYTFDNPGYARIIVSLGGQLGGAIMKDGYLKRVGSTEIDGWVNEQTYVGMRKLFFVIQFDMPFEQLIGWRTNSVPREIGSAISGEQLGAYAGYKISKGQILKIKVAISWCGIEQARLNLTTEINHWDFEKVKQESKDEWNAWLGRIEVKGGSRQQKIKFYTDVWHALLGRRQIDDVNGKYPDYMSGSLKVKQLPLDALGKPLFMHRSTDALWLTMWNLNILWGMAYPEVLDDFVNSAMVYYKDGGNLPRGPVVGKESWIMTGSPITELIVGAYMKGIRGYNIDAVYEACKKAHMPGGTMDKDGGYVQKYIDLGFIPETKPPNVWGGAGRLMEDVTQDWALAQLARCLGKKDDADYFLRRSTSWVNIFDPSIGFVRPKNENGSWSEPFDSLLNGNYGGFVEANSWQATWMAVHDVKGLINLLGGADNYCRKLNYAFEQARSGGFEGTWGDTTINYSNEPGLEMAHLFNYAGQPWLSQYWVRQVYEAAYSGITPYSGYGGNDEDEGQMGALSALMAMGIFDIKGGCDIKPMYQITTPVFSAITIHLNRKYYHGTDFTIVTHNNSSKDLYIQSATLNGEELDRCWFYHDAFQKGGRLELTLGASPNKKWGVQDLPPSETTGEPSFEASHFIYPNQVEAGKSIEVSHDIENRGSLGTYFGKLLLDGKPVAHQEIILREGEKTNIVYKIKLYDAGRHYLSVSRGNGRYPINISYRKSEVKFLDTEIGHRGEIISAKAILWNDGSDTVNKTIEFKVNGKMIQSEFLRLAPGGQSNLVFTYNAPASRRYDVEIDNGAGARLEVQKPVERPQKGLVMFYDFSDTKTPLLDLSGRKHYPLPCRLPVLKTNDGVRAIDLGTNAYLKFANTDAINLAGSVTFCMAIYPTHWNAAARLVQKGRDDNQFTIFRNGDKLEFSLFGVENGRLAVPLPPLNTWSYLVFQYDKKEKKLQIWMNSKLVAERRANGETVLTSDPLFIGIRSDQSRSNEHFDGYFKGFRIYNRPLSLKEIEWIYRAASGDSQH